MKKLFYIVLVIVVLMVIGRFIKQGNQVPAAEPATEVIAVEAETPEAAAVDEVAVDENGNVIAEEEIISESVAEGIEEAVSPEAANAVEDESHEDIVPAGDIEIPEDK